MGEKKTIYYKLLNDLWADYNFCICQGAVTTGYKPCFVFRPKWNNSVCYCPLTLFEYMQELLNAQEGLSSSVSSPRDPPTPPSPVLPQFSAWLQHPNPFMVLCLYTCNLITQSPRAALWTHQSSVNVCEWSWRPFTWTSVWPVKRSLANSWLAWVVWLSSRHMILFTGLPQTLSWLKSLILV